MENIFFWECWVKVIQAFTLLSGGFLQTYGYSSYFFHSHWGKCIPFVEEMLQSCQIWLIEEKGFTFALLFFFLTHWKHFCIHSSWLVIDPLTRIILGSICCNGDIWDTKRISHWPCGGQTGHSGSEASLISPLQKAVYRPQTQEIQLVRTDTAQTSPPSAACPIFHFTQWGNPLPDW